MQKGNKTLICPQMTHEVAQGDVGIQEQTCVFKT